jgi:hypothetical protein
MKSFVLSLTALTILFFATKGQAHLEPGVYKGKDQNLEDCSFEVKRTYFKDGVKHPLNERIEIVIAGLAREVQHPALITYPSGVESGRVHFNHDIFEAVYSTAVGAQSITVDFDHDAKLPTQFTLIESDWVQKSDKTVICKLEKGGSI